MKTVNLLSTVAATFLLLGAASAQAVKNDEAPAGAPAARRQAPAEKMAPALKPAERRTPATIGQASPGVNGRARKAPETTGQAPPRESEPDNRPANIHPMDKGAEQHRATTGQGAASGSAKMSSEKRSKITTIIRRQKVAPAHLNVSVRVGTRIPDSVRFYPLPVEVVAVYPEWRGYDYILVGDEIVVIDPRTHEIVAILDA